MTSAFPTLTFLGTGAAGGTPGVGRSRRRESSALATADEVTVLIDVTRDLPAQLDGIDRVDGIVLTHGHADAIGGFAAASAVSSTSRSSPPPQTSGDRSDRGASSPSRSRMLAIPSDSPPMGGA